MADLVVGRLPWFNRYCLFAAKWVAVSLFASCLTLQKCIPPDNPAWTIV